MPRKPSSPRQFLRFCSSAAQPILAVDRQNVLMFANAAAESWFNFVAAEMVGQSLAVDLAIPPEVWGGEVRVESIAVRTPHTSDRVQVMFLPLTETSSEVSGVFAVVLLPGCRWDLIHGNDEAAELRARLQELHRDLPLRFHAELFLGDSPQIRRVREQFDSAVKSNSRVLILGPGREAIAHAIYEQRGAKRGFVALDGRIVDAEELGQVVNALQKQRQRDPLHPPGLLLSHAEQLSSSVAEKLQDLLDQPQFDLSCVSTAATSLEVLAHDGKYPPRLAVQLSHWVIQLPKLSERAQDIPLLAQAFLQEWNREHPEQARSGFSPNALDDLCEYEWPGEVSELREVVFAASERAANPLIDETHLPEIISLAADAVAHPVQAPDPLNLSEYLAGIEKELIERTLTRAKQNKTKAAELLGMNRAKFLRRLQQLGLLPQEEVIFEPIDEQNSSS